MITSKYPQTSGINGQGFMEPKFGGKICNGVIFIFREMLYEPGVFLVYVSIKLLEHLIKPG